MKKELVTQALFMCQQELDGGIHKLPDFNRDMGPVPVSHYFFLLYPRSS